jgi:hypothetical protein
VNNGCWGRDWEKQNPRKDKSGHGNKPESGRTEARGQHPDPNRARGAIEAMVKMIKPDIAEVERAADDA